MKIFVYGTLKRGFHNHFLLKDAKFLGVAVTEYEYRMIDLGSFPALIPAQEGEGFSIYGEVYEVDDATLRSAGLFMGNVPLFYHMHARWRVVRGKRLDNDPTHCQYFSYDSLRTLLGEFFTIEAMVPLKGGRWAGLSMRLFARNVAFRCRKT